MALTLGQLHGSTTPAAASAAASNPRAFPQHPGLASSCGIGGVFSIRRPLLGLGIKRSFSQGTISGHCSTSRGETSFSVVQERVADTDTSGGAVGKKSRAIIIGGSIAGMLSAAAVAPYFDEVTTHHSPSVHASHNIQGHLTCVCTGLA